jgi:hypothetical protein
MFVEEINGKDRSYTKPRMSQKELYKKAKENSLRRCATDCNFHFDYEDSSIIPPINFDFTDVKRKNSIKI